MVGIGSSAGGLEALEYFFSRVPLDSGIAYVVVGHQHGDRPSMLPGILKDYAAIPIDTARDGASVEPNHIYVAPPGRKLSLHRKRFRVLEGSGPTLPIDYFFRALAREVGDRSAGVVLSGAGSDGTIGLKEIKAVAGFTAAQRPETAGYDSMPSSAINTGAVDVIGTPEGIVDSLVDYVRGARFHPAAEPRPPIEPDLQEILPQILVIVRDQVGHDFSGYKKSTMRRRIERRMTLHGIYRADHYRKYLQEHPNEVELLIGVTSFFRDRDAFSALQPLLADKLRQKPAGSMLRVWVAGCSTGEEAYSVAILARDAIEDTGIRREIQIFATDLDSRAIDIARAGIYPQGIAGDVTPERLQRSFTAEDTSYRVRKDIRELVVFATHNLISDPPFTKLDILVCRNVLIYMESQLQRRLLPLFHYALAPNGILFLGTAETVTGFEHLFEAADEKWKLYRRKDVGSEARPVTLPEFRGRGAGPPHPARRHPRGLEEQATKALADRFIPPSVIMNERGDIFHVRGRTGQFFEPAEGQPSTNAFLMAREGMRTPLATVVHRAMSEGGAALYRNAAVRTNGEVARVDVRAEALSEPEPLAGLFVVSFLQSEIAEEAAEATPEGEDRVRQLERELAETRQDMQSANEELEASNEELRSSNEELQSTNEELQSTNEELETSKEEMQSLNEELQTVNAEHQEKIQELSRVNDDMKNLLNATNVALVFLDDELRVKRFTPQAKEVVRLIPSDVGRPLGDITTHLEYTGLVADARHVLDTLQPVERTLRTRTDKWYLMRVTPYRTTDNVIAGVAISFIDVTELRTAVDEERLSQIRGARDAPAVALVDERGRIAVANPAFGRILGADAETVRGVFLADALSGWDVSALEEALGGLGGETSIEASSLETIVAPSASEEAPPLRIDARRVTIGAGDLVLLVLVVEPTEE